MIQMNLEGIPCPLITFCCSHNCVAFKIIWCKGKNFYDKGQGINAEPLTNVAIGDNKVIIKNPLIATRYSLIISYL